jgi:phage terminase large subunit
LIDINIPYKPLEKQKLFHKSKKPFRLYSGAVGAGKTLALCMEGIKLAFKYPGSRGLLGRYNYTDLKRTTLQTFLEVIRPIPERFYSYNKSDAEFKLKIPGRPESLILFIHLDDLQAIRSLNLDWFGVDEVTEVGKDVWALLETRLRNGVIDRLIGFGATNPDSKNHWAYKIFFENTDDDYEAIETFSYENTYLPKHYTAKLKKMEADTDFYDRYVLGKWGSFKGLVYKVFNRNIHIVPPRVPDPESRIYRGIDFGYNNPFVCIWLERTKDDVWYLFDEYYEREKLLSEHSIEIKRRNYEIERTYVDPSAKQERMELENELNDGTYNEYGLTPANNDVKAGILKVKEMLALDKNNRCRLYVCKNCVNVIKEKESYKYKVKDGIVLDEVVKENDHAMDAERYTIYTELGGFNPSFDKSDNLIFEKRK